jgi:hypothetical protein
VNKSFFLHLITQLPTPIFDVLCLAPHRVAFLFTYTMDTPEPDTPFAAVSAQTTRIGRVCNHYLVSPSNSWSVQPAAEARRLTIFSGISIISRFINTLYIISMDRHRCAIRPVCITDPLCSGLVYWSVNHPFHLSSTLSLTAP